ncbi:uncharacterized protein BDR25DRAFT_358987 [Lindgomyces ingoldianus]|uniref:Uncharacterized protein n=1 Tax=Lindgomyces ingoldianus TaxID=673940 RepID=A0ACB6QLC5_9PLEO|nr:uncharacterized protein BDR25DRAFT_358987 [Lindgomyces ingoldianus]KAF2466927.1 hypothetical protein BDR25DRAFT_358987 [Lindgomyces ingoldianus]
MIRIASQCARTNSPSGADVVAETARNERWSLDQSEAGLRELRGSVFGIPFVRLLCLGMAVTAIIVPIAMLAIIPLSFCLVMNAVLVRAFLYDQDLHSHRLTNHKINLP